MDFLRVPDLLNAHLAKDFDRQWSSTILGHGHVRRQNSNFTRMVDLLPFVRLEADDLLSERKRIIVQDRLRQLGQGRSQNSRY